VRFSFAKRIEVLHEAAARLASLAVGGSDGEADHGEASP
jgi:hypothetical protein